MIGHCGGLRPSQTIGDYVLAHAYLRDDHVLDDVLPPEVPLPAIAEVQNALVRRDDDDHRRGRRQRQAAAAHRHGGDHRRPQLGASLRRLGAALQPEPGGRDRHGIGDGRGTGLSLPRALRDAAMRVRQAAPRRAEAAGPGECLLRARDQPASADRDRGAEPAAARRRRAAQPQAPQLRRAAAALADREDLPGVGHLDLGRGRRAVLADREAADFADHLDRLADERRFEIRAIFLGQARHRRGADRDAEVGWPNGSPSRCRDR